METTVTNIATEGKFFDFDKARVQQLNLTQLERTHKENDVYGNPLRGVYHFQLINDIIALCEEQHFDVEVYDLFAAQNKDRSTPGVVLLPQVEAIHGQRAVEAHILRRVFANVRIKDFDEDGYTTNLAIAFHQKGIQVGFGNNVKICHNQCMLSPTQYIATYGEKGEGRGNGHTLAEVMDAVKSWLVDARHIIVTEREKIAAMQAIECDARQLYTLIGLLTSMRVACDTRHKEIRTYATYPLNQAQICAFTEALMLHYNRHGRVTVWDIYNAATDLYKADAMDIPAIMPQNRAMVAFLGEQFNLNLAD